MTEDAIRMRLAGIPGTLRVRGDAIWDPPLELIWTSDCGDWCVSAYTPKQFVNRWAEAFRVAEEEQDRG